jgi:hypothetical protein
MYVYNPDGLDPRDHLPPHLHAYSGCARVLVDVVETARVFHKLHDTEFISLKAAYLRRIIHKAMYLPIRDALRSAGVLDLHLSYIVGKKSYGFKIGSKFAAVPFRSYQLTDQSAIRRLKAIRA